MSSAETEIPSAAKAPEPPPDTLDEVALGTSFWDQAVGTSLWNKTFTFGGGALRVVNGTYSGIQIVDLQRIQGIANALHDPRSKIHQFTIAYADQVPFFP